MDFMWKLLGLTAALAEEGGEAAQAAATTAEELAQEPGTMGTVASLIVTMAPMLLLLVVFYFLLIRPQRKKDKQVQDMLASLKVGDRVCTIGGIYGTITAVKDDLFTLAVGNKNTPFVVARWAIRSVEDQQVENDAEALN